MLAQCWRIIGGDQQHDGNKKEIVILRSPANIKIREGGGKDLNIVKAPQNDNLFTF